jgi:peptidoglycan hydrolase-like amidase
MSQYGAYGRAKEGQNVDDILHAYYGNIEIKKDYSTDININVQGQGSYNIEEYVKRIYEMPAGWADKGGMEALKAQAVAARSYALAIPIMVLVRSAQQSRVRYLSLHQRVGSGKRR